MKEYKFEKITLTGIKGIVSKPSVDYHEVIHEHAKEGWELVQVFAPGTASYGSASYIEIIFSRDVE
ncbi:DUF4177 domain-containing protein [Bacillus alkalicellulosilyticus]|uniref:DUF4177 domain-containing protein n=1 Tax=Alkalihalobacterium alkalicellulosilyticum TaxID=1912214 RepID=UPI000997AEBC|nr:DUF4177 domain-containing protein [Bacillus alkalicellulosilyticus]